MRRNFNLKTSLALLLILPLFMTACSYSSGGDSKSNTSQKTDSVYDVETDGYDNVETEDVDDSNSESESISQNDISDIPEYSGNPYCLINNNQPSFDQADINDTEFETYSKLDSLGRCGVAYANICQDIMPTKERGEIGTVRPTGWHTVKYNGLVDGNYLYNRCHLIAYCLAGENANTLNLITGTRYMNVEGMLPFEEKVANYVDNTDNHVLYRVKPIFQGDNLLASGVEMEAYSVEDKGQGISFHVYCYNVQPGVDIDYSTGESSVNDEGKKMLSKSSSQSSSSSSNSSSSATSSKSTSSTNNSNFGTSTELQKSCTYLANTNTKKFHKPSCRYAKQTAEKNRYYFNGSKEEIISQGYSACKVCNP